jgi:transposase-like protein
MGAKTSAEMLHAIRLYQDGKEARDAARIAGVRRESLYARLKLRGIKLRARAIKAKS